MATKLKDTNKSEIVKLIRSFGPISIKEISSQSGLSVPCVMKHIDEMTEQGLLTEAVNADTRAGRKPKTVSIMADYRYIMGIDMGGGRVELGLGNLKGETMARCSMTFQALRSGKEEIDAVVAEAQAMLRQHGINPQRLHAIVIGNPGVVDIENGTIIMQAASAKWHDVPVKKVFEEAFGCHVVVCNDVNLSAIGEQTCGNGRGYRNFLYIRDDVGLKAGIIIDGKLFDGERHAAGEIGLNIVLQQGAEKLDATSIARIEDRVSMSALVREVAAQMPNYPQDILSSIAEYDPSNVTVDTITRALDDPKSFVSAMVEKKARLLAIAVANLVLILDVSLVIFGGDIIKLHNHVLRPMRQTLAAVLTDAPTVMQSSLGDNACLIGAIAVGLEYAFETL